MLAERAVGYSKSSAVAAESDEHVMGGGISSSEDVNANKSESAY